MADRQRLALRGSPDAALCQGNRQGATVHTDQQPAIQRHGRELCQNLQTGLRQEDGPQQCRIGYRAASLGLQALQRGACPRGAQDQIAENVQAVGSRAARQF